MAANFMIPPVGFGPGSQPGAEDGEELAYVPMPSGMRTFEPRIPYLQSAEDAAEAVAFLRELAAGANCWTPESGVLRFDYAHLDAHNRKILADTLGEGEVALVIENPLRVDVQESVFAGVWRVARKGGEYIEIGAIPSPVLEPHPLPLPAPEMPGPGVVNAPAILTEILDHVRNRNAGGSGGQHVVNLTLLPHTPEDLGYIERALGRGGVTILSRGYGNCRVERTAYANVWRIRFYNSQDVQILDTIEVADVPDVACAAPEDIADSAERLTEVAEALS
jgi:hydrogenase-1 operon protein HyaF